MVSGGIIMDRDEAAYVQLKFRVRERLRALLETEAEQRGVSLNAEIVRRLEESFELRPYVDLVGSVVTAGGTLNAITLEINSLQGDALELVEDLRGGNYQEKALAIARKMSSIQQAVLGATGTFLDHSYTLLPLQKTPLTEEQKRGLIRWIKDQKE
jgi:hypothetical protein